MRLQLILANLCVALLSSLSISGHAAAAVTVDKPAEVNHEYSFLLQVCRKHAGGCSQTAVTRLGAMAGDPAIMGNHRQVSFLGPAQASPGSTAAVAPAGSLELQSVRVGYELSLTPMYETDGTAYVRYDLVATQIVRWIPGASAGDQHIPDLQGTTITGTDKLKVGQSFLIDRAGYIFEVKLLGATSPTQQ